MGPELAIAAIGLGIAAGGAAVQYQGIQQQRSASQAAIAVQQQQEAVRMRQMRLEAMRRQREMVRTAIQQRAMALASTTASGASGGSALPGAYGQVSGRFGVNQLGVTQNLQLGEKMFGLNTQLLGAYRASADATATQQIGTGMITLGNTVMSNAGAINRIGQQVMAPRTA